MGTLDDEAVDVLAESSLALADADEVGGELAVYVEELRSRVGELRVGVEGAQAEHTRFHPVDAGIGTRAENLRHELEGQVAALEHLDLDRHAQRIEDAWTRIDHAAERAALSLERARRAREESEQARSDASTG